MNDQLSDKTVIIIILATIISIFTFILLLNSSDNNSIQWREDPIRSTEYIN